MLVTTFGEQLINVALARLPDIVEVELQVLEVTVGRGNDAFNYLLNTVTFCTVWVSAVDRRALLG